MGENKITAAVETPEQIFLSESRSQSEREASSSKGGIMEAIMGFIKFLWESFFPSKDAPDEDPQAPERKPVTTAEMARLSKLIINKKAIPNWKLDQESSDGQKVEHINPVEGGFRKITRDMGNHLHPLSGDMKKHNGVDLKARIDNPNIMASAEGRVLFSGEKSGYGNTVILGHKDGSWTLYAHMRDKPDENIIGSKVAKGQKIGVMGSSGGSTGLHLHYEQGKGDERLIPKIAGVGALVNGVEYAAVGKSSQMATLLDGKRYTKFPVNLDAKPGPGSPRFDVAKIDTHEGHTHN